MPSWRSLSTSAGFIFARSNPSRDALWSWIVEATAHQFDCDESDVSLFEDDDGRELITVCGETVAEIHNGYVRQDLPANHSYAEAAE